MKSKQINRRNFLASTALAVPLSGVSATNAIAANSGTIQDQIREHASQLIKTIQASLPEDFSTTSISFMPPTSESPDWYLGISADDCGEGLDRRIGPSSTTPHVEMLLMLQCIR